MGKEIKVKIQYQDVDGLQEVTSTAYLLSESICYEVVGDTIFVKEVPIRERGKTEITIYETDNCRAFEIYCENAQTNIADMTAVEFVGMLLQGQ
jgi:hypothetical protein